MPTFNVRYEDGALSLSSPGRASNVGLQSFLLRLEPQYFRGPISAFLVGLELAVETVCCFGCVIVSWCCKFICSC
jgi:hypothetical protein